ncbi:MAG TPA: PorP/SprF family type IX secretion system membrane protein [Bacteroidia bacterium]|jgi:type IX secretion system PorP/SprF family membrane protein|nr:PorP/SprF family type IX secretion system membrane protein [Bacteroidia bacterium]
MKTKLFSFRLALLILASVSVQAQDFHLSQYDAAALYLNPALTGMYGGEKGDYRISNDFRSQWSSLGSKPFTTIFLSYDQPYTIGKKKIGLGAYLINERAGIGHFNTLDFMVSGSYNIIEGSDKHYLTTGLQMGFFNKSFNPSAYTYDAQYSSASGSFDNSLPTEESFGTTNMFRFDANMGIYYKYIAKESKVHPFAGFSIYHLNMPKESFTGQGTRLPMRFSLNVGCDITTSEKLVLTPVILYMTQARATELYMGVRAAYKINTQYSMVAGLNYRNQDAFVIDIGLKQDGHVFRIGYDINTSGLSPYTGGRGAIELSLILTGIKGQKLFVTKPRI